MRNAEVKSAHPEASQRHLLRDERGAMFAEAVLSLPIFLLVYSLMVFVHTGFDRAHIEGKIARSDAWAHTYGNCEDSSVISSGTTVDSADTGAIAGGAGALLGITVFGQFMSMIGDQPLIFTAPNVFAPYDHEQHNYERTSQLDRPIGGQSKVGNQVALRCNEAEKSISLFLWVATAWLTHSGDIKP